MEIDGITIKMFIETFFSELEKYDIIEERKEEHYRDNPMSSCMPARVEKTVKYKIVKRDRKQ